MTSDARRAPPSESVWPNDSFDHPQITANGRKMLGWLRTHPNAPIFTDSSGSRLTEDDLAAVRRRSDEIVSSPSISFADEVLPDWMPAFLNRIQHEVPFHKLRARRETLRADRFTLIPTTSRADFSNAIASHVPNDVEIDRLISFDTSGTTGHRLIVPSHPQVAALYLAHHRRAMRRMDLDMTARSGNVAVALIGYQEQCFTYASVMPLLDDAGLVKVNLHPSAWRDPDDRMHYLESLNPEVLSGDPVSFAELLKLSLRLAPRAVFSTSMTLQPALRALITSTFGCPVFDFYSMNEAGPIGVFDESIGGFALLQPNLFVEILSDSGERLADGIHGEVTLTGGFNFCLPLLRYRTGDFAARQTIGNETVLVGLTGRPPVRFRCADGSWRNNNDMSHLVRDIPLAQFGLHQLMDGSMILRVQGSIDDAHMAGQRIGAHLGQKIVLDSLPISGTKIVQYTTDIVEGIVRS